MRNLVPLLIIPLLISAGQLLFKQASGTSGLLAHNRAIALLTNPYLLVALLIYFGSTLWWVIVLRDTPLSRAYPFMALSFIYVPLLSWIFFRDPMTIRTFLGTLCIVAGLITITTAAQDNSGATSSARDNPVPKSADQ